MNKHAILRLSALTCVGLGLSAFAVVTRSASVEPKQQKVAHLQNTEPSYERTVSMDELMLSYNRKFGVYSDSKSNVTVLDVASRKVLWKRLEMNWDIARLAVSSNGLYLAGAGSDLEQNQSGQQDEVPYVVYLANIKTKRVRKIPGYAGSLTFSPDSNSLIIAGHDGLISYNVNTGSKLRTLSKEPSTGSMSSSSMKFSPDGKLLAVGSSGGNSDGHVRVWNFSTGKLLQDFSNAYDPIVFSPDSKVLATSGKDPQPEPHGLPHGSYTESSNFLFQDFAVKVWDVRKGSVRILKHKGRQTDGTADPKTFSSHGQLLLTTNGDLWDVKTQKFVGRNQEVKMARNGTFVIGVKKTKR